MSIGPYFAKHVKDGTHHLLLGHLELLRAFQSHDDPVVAALLREIVIHVAQARELLDELRNVKRKPDRLNVEPTCAE